MNAPISVLWEFMVHPDHESEFRRCYGPKGEWARLFARAPGYLGTELLQDRLDPLRYLTIDRWRSEADYAAFREQFATDYAALDNRCAYLRVAENHVGTCRVSTGSATE